MKKSLCGFIETEGSYITILFDVLLKQRCTLFVSRDAPKVSGRCFYRFSFLNPIVFMNLIQSMFCFECVKPLTVTPSSTKIDFSVTLYWTALMSSGCVQSMMRSE